MESCQTKIQGLISPNFKSLSLHFESTTKLQIGVFELQSFLTVCQTFPPEIVSAGAQRFNFHIWRDNLDYILFLISSNYLPFDATFIFNDKGLSRCVSMMHCSPWSNIVALLTWYSPETRRWKPVCWILSFL